MNQSTILMIDNNENFLKLFCCLPESDDFTVVPFTSAGDAFDYLLRKGADVVISDVQMPEMTGIELLARMQDMRPDIPVILITAYGSSEEAITAIKQGAFHYFEKPIDDKLDLFWSTLRKAIDKRRMLEEIESLRKEKALRAVRGSSIIGVSRGIKKVRESIEEVGGLKVTVLISGETGTGKELVARAIHEQSPRRNNSFFAVNCSEFAPGIMESELFGHEKGSFTGAVGQKKGLFEIADKGTLFLDEISNAPMVLQSKLLRVLEAREFKRVGGTSNLYSDFRVVAATNINLETAVAEQRFRQDLLYRLNMYIIEIPPLRERKDDIPVLVEYYFKRFAAIYHRSLEGISETAMNALINYQWPGNVRELVNVIERAVITCRKNMITTRNLPFASESGATLSSVNLKEMEKHMIRLALQTSGHNKTRASEMLGIARKTLIEKIRRYHIEKSE
ncbi:MAG: sigma-54-dependent transcriptional regulator [Thermodesulfobacteriota bacterium]